MANPVKEIMEGSYYYESGSVGKTRSNKTCGICNESIPKGSSHNKLKCFNDEYYDINVCTSCETKYSVELAELRAGKYDNY